VIGAVVAEAARMRTKSVLIPLLTAAVTACGDGSQNNPTPDAPPDSPPDAELPGEPISIDTFGEPDLIAVKDGARPWRVLPVAGNLYEVDVHGPYILAVVCDDGAGFIELYQLARTLADDREQFFFCFEATKSTFGSAVGTMVQAGSVTVGFSTDTSPTENWGFDIFAEEGVHELFAQTPDRVAIRRDVTITGETAIPPLDLAQEGIALVPANASATNATAGEQVSAQVSLVTPNFTFARLPRGPIASAKLVPDAALVVQDNQRLSVSAFSAGGGSRNVFRFDVREGSTDEITFTVAQDQVAVNWGTLPAHDLLDANLQANSEDFATFWFHDLDISPAFVAETNATSATIDTDIPGFRDEWKIDLDKEYFRSLSAIAFRADENATSSFSQVQNQGSTAAPRQPLTKREVRELRRHSSLKFASRNLSISAK
jgi:hypothetical protein